MQQSPIVLDLCLWKTWEGNNESQDYCNLVVFEKLRFQKGFFHTKTQSLFEEPFRKAPFSWRISVDGRPNQRIKAAFPNFPGVLWTGPKTGSVICQRFAFSSCLYFHKLGAWWQYNFSNCLCCFDCLWLVPTPRKKSADEKSQSDSDAVNFKVVAEVEKVTVILSSMDRHVGRVDVKGMPSISDVVVFSSVCT